MSKENPFRLNMADNNSLTSSHLRTEMKKKYSNVYRQEDLEISDFPLAETPANQTPFVRVPWGRTNKVKDCGVLVGRIGSVHKAVRRVMVTRAMNAWGNPQNMPTTFTIVRDWYRCHNDMGPPVELNWIEWISHIHHGIRAKRPYKASKINKTHSTSPTNVH